MAKHLVALVSLVLFCSLMSFADGQCLNTSVSEYTGQNTSCCVVGQRLAAGKSAQWDFFAGLSNPAATREPFSSSFSKFGDMIVNTAAATWRAGGAGVSLDNSVVAGGDPLVSEKTIGESGIFASNKDFALELWIKPANVAQSAIIASIHDPDVYPSGTSITNCGPGTSTSCAELLVISQEAATIRVQMPGFNGVTSTLLTDDSGPYGIQADAIHLVFEFSATESVRYSTRSQGWAVAEAISGFNSCSAGPSGYRCATDAEPVLYVHSTSRNPCLPYDFMESQSASGPAEFSTSPWWFGTQDVGTYENFTIASPDVATTPALNTSKLVIGHIQSGSHWRGEVFMAALYEQLPERAAGNPTPSFSVRCCGGFGPAGAGVSPRSVGFKYMFAAGLPSSTPFVSVTTNAAATEDNQAASTFPLSAGRITSSTSEVLNFRIVTRPSVGSLFYSVDGSTYTAVTIDAFDITLSSANCNNSASTRTCTVSMQYLSPLNANGQIASFTYQAVSATDAEVSSVGSVIITVAAVNDPPLVPVYNGATTVVGGQTLAMPYTQTDCCSETGELNLKLACQPILGNLYAPTDLALNTPLSSGTALTGGASQLTYRPRAVNTSSGQEIIGTDTICVGSQDSEPLEGPILSTVITITNPLSIDAVSVTGTEDIPLNISFTVSNADANFSASVVIITAPSKGVFQSVEGVTYGTGGNVQVANTITYVPNAHVNGLVETLTIAYQRTLDGFSSVQRTLTITLAAVNDAPNITAPQNVITGTTNDFEATFQTIPFLFTDVEQGSLFFVTLSVVGPGSGTFSLGDSSGVGTLLPATNSLAFNVTGYTNMAPVLANIRFTATTVGAIIIRATVNDNNQHNVTADATLNITCPRGYTRIADATTCTACSQGRAKATSGFDACSNCPEGSYQNASAQTQCVVCAAGTFSNATGFPNCVSCPVNTFAANTNATSCVSCGVGELTAGQGSTACVCQIGKTRSSGNCVDCDANSIKTAIGDQACTACLPGSQVADSARTTCLCVAGRFLSGSTCDLCGVDTYKPLASNDNSCTPCNSNTSTGGQSGSTSASACQCEPGLEPNALAVSGCAFCREDTYKETVNNTACTPCPAGTNTSAGLTGASLVSQCLSPPDPDGGDNNEVIDGVPLNTWQISLAGGVVGLAIGVAAVLFTKRMVNKRRRSSHKEASDAEPQEQLQDWMTRDVDEELATAGQASSQVQLNTYNEY